MTTEGSVSLILDRLNSTGSSVWSCSCWGSTQFRAVGIPALSCAESAECLLLFHTVTKLKYKIWCLTIWWGRSGFHEDDAGICCIKTAWCKITQTVVLPICCCCLLRHLVDVRDSVKATVQTAPLKRQTNLSGGGATDVHLANFYLHIFYAKLIGSQSYEFLFIWSIVLSDSLHLALYQVVQKGNISCILTPVVSKCYFDAIWRNNPKQRVLVLNLTSHFFAVPEGVYC